MQTLSGQETSSTEIPDAGTISVIGGAQIYSTDATFNKQILKKEIKISGSLVSYNRYDQRLSVSNQKKKISTAKNFASQVTELAKKKKEKLSERTKYELAQYENRKKEFDNKKINPFSPDHFFSSESSLRNYAVPQIQNHENSKANFAQYFYAVKSALDHLHSHRYVLYNSRSIDFCFSKVFSVRPPPILA